MPRPGRTSKSSSHTSATPPSRSLELSPSNSPSSPLGMISRGISRTRVSWTTTHPPWSRGPTPSLRPSREKTNKENEPLRLLLLRSNCGDPGQHLTPISCNNFRTKVFKLSNQDLRLTAKLKMDWETLWLRNSENKWNCSLNWQVKPKKMWSSWPLWKDNSKTFLQKKASMLSLKRSPHSWMDLKWFGLSQGITKTLKKCKSLSLLSLTKLLIKLSQTFRSINCSTFLKKQRQNYQQPEI